MATRLAGLVALLVLIGFAAAREARPANATPRADGRPHVDRPIGRLHRHYRRAPAHRSATIDEETYRYVRDASLASWGRFDPRRFFALHIGRSPTLLNAFQQTVASRSGRTRPNQRSWIAAGLPASNIRHGFPAEHAGNVHALFDAFLPDDVKRGERAVVLLDRVAEAGTLEAISSALHDYLRGLGVADPQIIHSGYAERPVAPRHRFDGWAAVDHDRALPHSGGGFAENDVHDLAAGARLADLKPRDVNQRLRDDLLAFARRDRTLDRALAQIGGLVEPARSPRRRSIPAPRATAWRLARPYRPGLPRVPRRTGDRLSAAAYAEVGATAMELMRRFPPDRYGYVWGAEVATPLIAYLDALGARVGHLRGPHEWTAVDQERFSEAFEGSGLAAMSARRMPVVIGDGSYVVARMHQGVLIEKAYLVRNPKLQFGEVDDGRYLSVGTRDAMMALAATGIRPRPDRQQGERSGARQPPVSRRYRELRAAMADRQARDLALDRFLSRPQPTLGELTDPIGSARSERARFEEKLRRARGSR